MSARQAKRQFADPSDLVVVKAGDSAPRQFSVENAPGILEDFDAQYVHVSGYFGIHDPQVFAMAPKLLAHLEFAVKLLSGFPALSGHAQIAAMREVIAEATGAA